MTTPEQLAKWREEFERKLYFPNDNERVEGGRYRSVFIHHEWCGYVRAKQEYEQALKDARKQALEDVLKLAEDHKLDLDGSEYHRGWRNASTRIANLIKELLK